MFNVRTKFSKAVFIYLLKSYIRLNAGLKAENKFLKKLQKYYEDKYFWTGDYKKPEKILDVIVSNEKKIEHNSIKLKQGEKLLREMIKHGTL